MSDAPTPARSLLSLLLALPVAFQPGLAQDSPPGSASTECDPCVVQFDTVAILRSTSSAPLRGTTIFERVGSYFVMADLLDGTQVRVHDSSGGFVGYIPGPGGAFGFSEIQALQAVPGDSIAVFDAGLKKLAILDLHGNVGREVNLPMEISPGGGLIQEGSIALASGLREAEGRITILGAEGGERRVPTTPRERDDPQRGLDGLRILGHGHQGTFWVLHFLVYRAVQHDLRTGALLRVITRAPEWMASASDAHPEDWRYASLLGASQPSPERLWVLGRSNDPGYSPESIEVRGAPLAGRESVWDLELDLLSLPEGDVVASVTLPSWVGGFTSDGLLYFFDELESDWGQIVVVRPGLRESSPPLR